MKRYVSTVLILSVIFLLINAAMAEEDNKNNVFESIGSFFSNTWDNVSSWSEARWTDFSSWVNGAWGDASKWVSQVWNDSSTWVTDIWGDASNWVVESYESASDSIGAWWAKTFNRVTVTDDNAWNWLRESATDINSQSILLLSQMKDAIISSEDAEQKAKDTFYLLLANLNISESDAENIWKTIQAYSDEKGIASLTAVRISLPYLWQLAIDNDLESNGNIPAVAVAQYLTAIYEKMGIISESSATDYIEQLIEVLESF